MVAFQSPVSKYIPAFQRNILFPVNVKGNSFKSYVLPASRYTVAAQSRICSAAYFPLSDAVGCESRRFGSKYKTKLQNSGLGEASQSPELPALETNTPE